MFIHFFSALLIGLALAFSVAVPAWCVHREVLDQRQREHERQRRLDLERVIDLEAELDAYRQALEGSMARSAR